MKKGDRVRIINPARSSYGKDGVIFEELSINHSWFKVRLDGGREWNYFGDELQVLLP